MTCLDQGNRVLCGPVSPLLGLPNPSLHQQLATGLGLDAFLSPPPLLLTSATCYEQGNSTVRVMGQSQETSWVGGAQSFLPRKYDEKDPSDVGDQVDSRLTAEDERLT